jgi:hypothetical protein
MSRDLNGELRLLLPSEQLALRVAMRAARRCGYVRAAAALESALARDSTERGPRLTPPAWRFLDGR